jgi:hypothetical protein
MLDNQRNREWSAGIATAFRQEKTNTLAKYTTDVDSSSRLRSVTQEKDLDEFLNTAQLAGTEFTAGMHSAFSIENQI